MDPHTSDLLSNSGRFALEPLEPFHRARTEAMLRLLLHFEDLQSGLLLSDMMRRPTLPLKERELPLTGGRLLWLEACLALWIP